MTPANTDATQVAPRSRPTSSRRRFLGPRPERTGSVGRPLCCSEFVSSVITPPHVQGSISEARRDRRPRSKRAMAEPMVGRRGQQPKRGGRLEQKMSQEDGKPAGRRWQRRRRSDTAEPFSRVAPYDLDTCCGWCERVAKGAIWRRGLSRGPGRDGRDGLAVPAFARLARRGRVVTLVAAAGRARPGGRLLLSRRRASARAKRVRQPRHNQGNDKQQCRAGVHNHPPKRDY